MEPHARSVIEADLMQMVYGGGRERTLLEYRALIEAAFGSTRRWPYQVIHGLWKPEGPDQGPYHPAHGRSIFP
jgi:hypothetical protein